MICCNWSGAILPISFRVTSQALGQSYDCPSAYEVILKDMGKWFTQIYLELLYNHSKTKHNKCVCIYHKTLYVYGIWSTLWKNSGKHVVINLKCVLPLSPCGWRGIVAPLQASRWAGWSRLCWMHFSETAGHTLSIRSSVEFCRPVVVQHQGHLSICPIWAKYDANVTLQNTYLSGLM